MKKEDFIQAGFTVVGTDNNENKLLRFLKENYPSIIKDNEIDLNELKAIACLPIDERVNGYGLNFVGRNFARGKYAQKTTKELHLNTQLSKNIDTTQNLVLKGDNLDSLKILKSYYTGKIKCIYIDPPYNTNSSTEELFIYPDKFDKEEAEVLGLVNLSEDDFARMDFSFKTKRSHNGWLSFIYPRLLLARDLLSNDGVIFISIDDNEQANLKLLCDDVFGEENFINNFIWLTGKGKKDTWSRTTEQYILCYAKNKSLLPAFLEIQSAQGKFSNPDNDPRGDWFSGSISFDEKRSNGTRDTYFTIISPSGVKWTRQWQVETKEEMDELLKDNRIYFGPAPDYKNVPRKKIFTFDENEIIPTNLLNNYGTTLSAQTTLNKLFSMQSKQNIFDNPKPVTLIAHIINILMQKDTIILDFFAGSGTTGHAVMQLNAEDGGNRKFILCQIDEPIKKDKPAYKFCKDNNLPTVISSITIERLKRAGEKIAKKTEAEKDKSGLFEGDKKQVPDVGFKVFDSVEAPKLKLDERGQISILFNDNDALSRIYNMIFAVGLDEPTQVPQEVVKDCIYKIGNHYYITNSDKIKKDDFADAVKKGSTGGKVFIDGWTASLNGTLQNYKEDVKIVF
ncbi:site-specific DNA-methyltransferase [Treponema putidum]|uniref:site-specific DNA-methyltransferase n=1 Tax=Treponema putidum TaxID=221027 RepID=UPI0004F71E41|nr:site-specific DNA-methyltransferase [Treponema putidum]AIN94632.1 DNA methylase [Treponema putidum]TWI78763.1 adenine-specific DNA-methyltransferase [Treponema putidum]